jgi:hypothetical protein
MVKNPGKSAAAKPAVSKPAGGGGKMNIPPAIKAEVRKIVREEISKAKQGK